MNRILSDGGGYSIAGVGGADVGRFSDGHIRFRQPFPFLDFEQLLKLKRIPILHF